MRVDGVHDRVLLGAQATVGRYGGDAERWFFGTAALHSAGDSSGDQVPTARWPSSAVASDGRPVTPLVDKCGSGVAEDQTRAVRSSSSASAIALGPDQVRRDRQHQRRSPPGWRGCPRRPPSSSACDVWRSQAHQSMAPTRSSGWCSRSDVRRDADGRAVAEVGVDEEQPASDRTWPPTSAYCRITAANSSGVRATACPATRCRGRTKLRPAVAGSTSAARTSGGLVADRLCDQGVGARGQVRPVLLGRADGYEADLVTGVGQHGVAQVRPCEVGPPAGARLHTAQRGRAACPRRIAIIAGLLMRQRGPLRASP